MRSLGNEKLKIFTPVNVVGFVLVVMAGWVDTISLVIYLDKRTSSMTGRASKLGLYLYNGEIREMSLVLVIILSFIVGAFMSTLMTRRFGLLGGLFFTSSMLVLTMFTTLNTGMHLSLITIPLGMGGLNAATSLTAIDRTTHLTGASTDIGINLAKGNWNGAIFWTLRWTGFLLGIAISLKFMDSFNSHLIGRPFLLLVPATVILLTGIIQKLTVNIPLLDHHKK